MTLWCSRVSIFLFATLQLLIPNSVATAVALLHAEKKYYCSNHNIMVVLTIIMSIAGNSHKIVMKTINIMFTIINLTKLSQLWLLQQCFLFHFFLCMYLLLYVFITKCIYCFYTKTLNKRLKNWKKFLK